jgi:ribosome-associated heat shock protein Hsp15
LDRQRIDKWLWHARLVRTRTAAAALAGRGHVRVNGARVDAPARLVKQGDVITVALDRVVRVLKVTGFAERRGPASATAGLYQDMMQDLAQDPAPVAAAGDDGLQPPPARAPGSGRPTKRERRAIDRLTAAGEDPG